MPYPLGEMENRRWRLGLLERASRDKDAQRSLSAICGADPVYWLAGFVWTYDPRRVDTGVSPVTPFIPWDRQVELLTAVQEHINLGQDLLTEKSRDEGATWIHLMAILHRWLYRNNESFLLASRTEDYVDKRGEPKSLFWKLEFALERMPPWMVPEAWQKGRTHLRLANPETGTVVAGESNNSNLGRGGRCTAMLLDEFAAVEDGLSVLSATADATRCRLFNSTPQRPPNAFSSLRNSGKVRVFTIHWTQNPFKNYPLYEVKGGDVKRLDDFVGLVRFYDGTEWRDVLYPGDYPFEREEDKRRSPWYDSECNRRSSKREIAQELDIEYRKAGELFFDKEVLDKVRELDVISPLQWGDVLYTFDPAKARVRFDEWKMKYRRGKIALWCQLDPWGYPTDDHNYVLGVDVSHGQGVSNSIISVCDVDTREKVAEFADSKTDPAELARVALALCQWFRGDSGYPYLIWEGTGPGGIFGKEVMRMNYPNVYYQRDELKEYPVNGKRPGWFSTRTQKEFLLEDYRRALSRREFVNHSEASIKEAEGYAYLQTGELGPGEALEDEGTQARKRHGDRVIADALSALGMQEQVRGGVDYREAHWSSFAAARIAAKRARARNDMWN